MIILAAFGYKWVHAQHRSERAERDKDWQLFMAAQQAEFRSNTERVVAGMREMLSADRAEHAAEMQKLEAALAANTQRVIERVTEVLAARLVETARQLPVDNGAVHG
jgi:hypothetical protein